MVSRSAVIARIGANCLLMPRGPFDESSVGRIFARARVASQYDRADSVDRSRDHKPAGAVICFLRILQVLFCGLYACAAGTVPHTDVERCLVIHDFISGGDGYGLRLLLTRKKRQQNAHHENGFFHGFAVHGYILAGRPDSKLTGKCDSSQIIRVMTSATSAA